MNFKSLFCGIAGIILMTSVASAQAGPTCNDTQLIIGTGTATGTYGAMWPTLASKCSMACGNGENTQGGYDNLMNVVNEKIDGGMVQVDVLEFINRTEPDVKRKVRSLVSLHGNQLHIFALANGFKTKKEVAGYLNIGTRTIEETVVISSLQDLKDRKVAAWSSAQITATIVSERLKLNLDIVNVNDRKTGLEMLRRGEVAAFMGMGGKPVEWVEGPKAEIKPTEVMVNVDSNDITKLGSPYYPVKVTYRAIGANGTNTISVRNEIVVRNFTRGPMVKAIVDFKACFVNNLEDMLADRKKHPSWSDVSLDNALGWDEYRTPTMGAMPPSQQAPAPRR